MLKHYWVTTLRTLARNKLFTFINLVGLSLSIALFFAFSGFVRHELSFDKFYPDSERIFRIDYHEYHEGTPVLQTAHTHDRTALLVHEYVPQVEAVARIYFEKAYVFNEDVRIVDQNMLFADSSFFRVFGVNMIDGSPESCLTPPRAVVISQSQAKVYFGDENPMGKTLFFNENLPFTVTGVFEDIPRNLSVDYDFLLSWSTLSYYGWVPKDGSFRYPWVFTFVKVRENISDLDAINDNLTRLLNEQHSELARRRNTGRMELRPYTKLHLNSGLAGELKPGINPALLYALLALAGFILLVAWINYINLALARSLERADEIGVRKVFGATRSAISGQFVLEAVLLALFTFFIGYGLFHLFTKPLSYVLFADVSFSVPGTPTLILYLLVFVVATALASLYPAHFISRYRPALILKNQLGSGKGSAGLLHQSLMVFQMFLAIAVVGVTLIAGRQLAFMRTFDNGFNSSQVINLRAPASTNSDSLRLSMYRAFRNEVLQNASFESGTASMNIPGEEIRFHDEGVLSIGSVNEKKQSFKVMWIDEGFGSTLRLDLLAGRDFNPEEAGKVCLINESGARALGFENPVEAVNTSIITAGQQLTIAGVWKDYHHESLRKSVEPTLFIYRHPHEYGYYSFRVNTEKSTYLSTLEQIWKKHYPNDTFNYYFMDRYYARQYEADQLFAMLLKLFSIISIAVACLGLFGMATLSIVKRTKEIGIRKVLGATVGSILLLISNSYIRLIAISCLLALPLSYYIAQQWLKDFTYKISIQWWMVILPGIVVLVAILLTISVQALRAALANPVKSIREQ